jgi:hypothetical protein
LKEKNFVWPIKNCSQIISKKRKNNEDTNGQNKRREKGKDIPIEEYFQFIDVVHKHKKVWKVFLDMVFNL